MNQTWKSERFCIYTYSFFKRRLIILFDYAIQIALMSRITNYNQTRLLEELRKFRSKIRNCSKSVNKWQSSSLCLRAEKKQAIYLINSIFFLNVKIKCPNNMSYVCDDRNGYCSINKQICDSFSSEIKNSGSSIKQMGIKKCNFNAWIRSF